MTKRQTLLAILVGSMLAVTVTGCGDDGGSNGSASSSCEAICNGNCLFGGVNPDVGQCLSQCESEAPELDDNCGSQMEAYLNCIEANDCNPASFSCLSQAEAWVACNGG